MKLAISLRTSMSRTVGRLLPLVGLALAACGGGGGAGLVGPTGPVRFDGPVYQAFTAFDGLADAAVTRLPEVEELRLIREVIDPKSLRDKEVRA